MLDVKRHGRGLQNEKNALQNKCQTKKCGTKVCIRKNGKEIIARRKNVLTLFEVARACKWAEILIYFLLFHM